MISAYKEPLSPLPVFDTQHSSTSVAVETPIWYNNYEKNISSESSPPIIEQNSERHIVHLRAPYQLNIFKNSPFAKATETSMYCAQFTTCGWVAAYLAHYLCGILSEDSTMPKEEILQAILERSTPDAFIRDTTSFIADLTPYGGSNDKVEGLILGEEIYSILKGMQTPFLENVFIIEGETEEVDLKKNDGILKVFNLRESFNADYKNPADFSPLKNTISEVASGKMPFIILVSLETFPLGQHFITYAFRKNSQDFLECLIYEGLNEANSKLVLFDPIVLQDTNRRSTTEWIYNDLKCSDL